MRPIPQITYDEALELAAKSGMLGIMLDEAVAGNEMEHVYTAYAALRLMVEINAGLQEKIQHMRGAMENMEKVTTQMATELEARNRSRALNPRPEAIDPEFGEETPLFELETRIPLGGVEWNGAASDYFAHRGQINAELAKEITNWAKDLVEPEIEPKTLGKAENAPNTRNNSPEGAE